MKFLDVEKYTPIQKSHEAYLKELMEYCKDTPRHPSYHIHPPCGLVNDPNGLAYFGGKYHVFYQWFPFGPEHGMKHWAHVMAAAPNMGFGVRPKGMNTPAASGMPMML